MIASQLARYPLLLDELLDQTLSTSRRRWMPTVMNCASICCACRKMTKNNSEALRQFKQAQLLRIAAADIAGTLPVMKVSDHLTAGGGYDRCRRSAGVGSNGCPLR